jgi:type II secretion system protein L
MKRIGISISTDRLSAYAWEKTLFSGRAVASCEVPCTEPWGSRDDVRALAGRLRELLGDSLPPVVLSLPPGECHVRMLELPVRDLKSARLIHVAEIEDSLPFDGEEIVSDIFPVDECKGLFIAFAARRSSIARFADLYSEAGFHVETVVTDPVALLCAAASAVSDRAFHLASFESDVVLLSVDDLKIRKVRQFPASILESPERFLKESNAFFESIPRLLTAGAPPSGLQLFGDLPRIALVPPGAFDHASAVAFGASLAPFSGKITHGFSLASSSQGIDEAGRQDSRLRFAAIASAVALLACIFALEMARWASARQVAVVRKQLRSEFSAAVPDAKVIVREAVQIREKTAALQRQRDELGLDLPRVTPLLATISAALPKDKSLSVKEISVDGIRLRVAGESGGAAAVESYRAALATSLGKPFDVTVQESRGSARGESVTFTILIEKRKADLASKS